MVAGVLILGVLVAAANAQIPSYIHVCGRRDPKLDQCIVESVKTLQPKLRAGIPELDVPPSEPWLLDHVTLIEQPNFKASASDVEIRGLSDHHVKNLHVNLEKQRIDIEAFFEQLILDALYDVTARVLVPVAGKGPIHITATDVNAKVVITYKLIEKGGKKYMFFDSMTTRLDIRDYTSKFEPTSTNEGAAALTQAINTALGNSRAEILESIRPNLEKIISEKVLSFANKIGTHFTYEELFPDRE